MAAVRPIPPGPYLGPRRPPSSAVINVAAAVVGLGLGACAILAVMAETKGSLSAAGGIATFAGRLAGLSGTYLLLIMVLLVARIPVVERAVGQDRLVRWHRLLGQWPIYLLLAHALLIIIGYSEQARTGLWHEFLILESSYPDVLATTVALGLIVAAGALSIRAARNRMRYETWWSIHLYMYLALALAFSHQLANGASFVGHPLTRSLWVALWVATAGTVVAFRLVMPLARSAWHGLRVVGVEQEAPGVVSIVLSGRYLEHLGAVGGQFFQWRFLKKGLWWQAHPYSLSAVPRPPYIRVTIKVLGDHSSRLARLPVGTRVLIEGPYGIFTDRARATNKVLLVGGGVGLTSIRALLEDLHPAVDVTVLTRASTPEEILFRGEIATLVDNLGGRTHELVGSRHKHPLDARHLRRLVPDIAQRDVYVCGPESLNVRITTSAEQLGVPPRQIHCEQFAF